jgi:hypothetical protein
MTRHKPALALLVSSVFVVTVSGQVKPASQAAAPPAAPAKWVPPMKADGTVELIKGKPRRVGNEMVTTLKVRNTSKGALALVTVDEYWYPATGTQVVSGDTQRHRALLNPGDVAELTLKSPYRPEMARSQYEFKHAHGKIKAKEVTKFVDHPK